MTDNPGDTGGPVTLINVFEIPAEQVETFLADWKERAQIMITMPGFRDLRMHRAMSSDTRFQLVNVAHWDSAEALRAAQAATANRVPTANAIVANPGLYQVVAEHEA